MKKICQITGLTVAIALAGAANAQSFLTSAQATCSSADNELTFDISVPAGASCLVTQERVIDGVSSFDTLSATSSMVSVFEFESSASGQVAIECLSDSGSSTSSSSSASCSVGSTDTGGASPEEIEEAVAERAARRTERRAARTERRAARTSRRLSRGG